MQTELETAQFGCFTLDLGRRVLLSGGAPVDLQPRTFNLLAYMFKSRGRSVHRDEILANVWPDRTVSENNLSVQLRALRKALEQAGCTEDVILTLTDQHYEFVAKVTIKGAHVPETTNGVLAFAKAPAPRPIEMQQRETPAWRRWTVACALGAAALLGLMVWHWSGMPGSAAPRLSFVVLPFRNASADQLQTYLADAITDDVTADLAHIPASTVIARESAEAVKHETPQAIGRDLNVAYILSGSVVPEETSYHLNASLIDASTGRELWTAQFDAARARVSATREGISRRIASTLRVALNEIEAKRALRDRPDDPDALDLFFRARSTLDGHATLADYNSAENQLRQAIAKAPNFLDARSELGWMLLRKISWTDDPDDTADFKESKALIRQVLSDSPGNTLALAAHARALSMDGKCEQARPVAERALALEPSSLQARLVLAGCAQTDRRFDEAIADYNEVLRLDPDGPGSRTRYLSLGTLELMQGAYPQAVELLNRASDDETPAVADMEPAEQAQLLLIAAHGLAGQEAIAKADYQVYARRFHGRTVWRVGGYFPREWRALPGLKRILAALGQAGMPQYADETAVELAGDVPCTAGDFAATPAGVPGHQTLSSADFAERLVSGTDMLVIDIGRGVAIPPGAIWFDPAKTADTEAQFAVRSARERFGNGRTKSIVVMGDGVTGCRPYMTVAELAKNGFSDVALFRGGEEAWARLQPSRGDFVLTTK